jgi:hypothetical protein
MSSLHLDRVLFVDEGNMRMTFKRGMTDADSPSLLKAIPSDKSEVHWINTSSNNKSWKRPSK